MINLKNREKKIVTVLGAVVIVALVQVVFISPSLKKRADLNQRIIQARQQLAELRVLKREYDKILVETERINQKVGGRPRSFTLFSFLDQTATKLNLKSNLSSMKPSRRTIDSNLAEEMVEVRLEGISLENLVGYLYEIERTGSAVAIASIRIQPESRLGGGLNVSMQVTSVGPP